MKRILRFFTWCLVALLMLLAIVAVWLNHRANAGLPLLDGELRVPGLQAKVRIVRDTHGVPHIFAENEPDAYFALGYVMAQDRLFQMELMRRLAAGELAELLGPLALPADRIVRSFRLKPKAQEFYTLHKGEHPEVEVLSESFVKGINHFMETEELPLEFAVLGIPKRPFTPVDCLSIAAILPITFAEGLRGDILASLLEEKFPDRDIDALFPGYSRERPVTVMETIEEAEAYLAAHPPAKPGTAARLNEGDSDALRQLDFMLAQLQTVTRQISPGLGSNSWVLGPTRTRSGRALLANDPHIGFMNPSIWYEANIKTPGWEWYGWYLPLIPFSLIGHNAHHAWALTMLENDDVDLYVEQFDPENPRRVKYKGEWTDCLVEEATIKVRFGKDEQWQVRVTKHGPVVTDLMRFVLGYDGPDIALSWVWQHLEYTDLLAFYQMSRAKSLAAFEDAVSKITSPGLNVSYVDADNNYAWWAAGRLEIRPPGTHPKRLLDGASGRHEIAGYVDFKDNPKLINPPSGYIVTANNLSTVKAVGPLPALEGYWQPSDRAERIEEVLETRTDWDIPATQSLQFDDEALAARRILPVWLELLGTAGFQGFEADALQRLKTWDRRQGVDSVGATIYQTMCMVLFDKTLGDEFTPLWLDTYYSVKDSWNSFKYWVGDADFPWWDDANTPEKETREDITRAAWRESIAHLRKTLGDNMDEWRWGRLHTMTFMHPFGFIPGLGGVFNIGPFPASGADHAVNNMMWPGGLNFAVIAGPSTRRVIDYAQPDQAYAVLPTGNSGHFRSPNFADQARMFMTGQYRRVNTTAAQIEADRRHELLLLPQS